MARELLTSWADYQVALDRILAIASHHICIYDEDLGNMKLESASRITHLKRVLTGTQSDLLRIAVRNGLPLHHNSPALLKMLTTYGHLASAQETPSQIAHLRDSMVIVDGKHALIRFERDLPRSKLLIDEPDEVRPYKTRFEEIWAEGGERIVSTVIGL
jgi:hypothetical protein